MRCHCSITFTTTLVTTVNKNRRIIRVAIFIEEAEEPLTFHVGVNYEDDC